jgi:Predicted transcriptional regulators
MNGNTVLPHTRMTLKMVRELKGVNQAEAAEKIGVSTDTLGNYERGKSYPDIPILRNIESYYGVSYSQIIFLPLDFGLTEQNKN